MIARSMLMIALMALWSCDAEEPMSPEQGREEECGREDVSCFELGWSGTSASAKLQVVDASPAEPIRGLNVWQISLTDLENRALSGCEITLAPYMPEHGHGVSTSPEISEPEGGSYLIEDISFTMPGLWELRFEVACADWTSPEMITYSMWLEA